MKGQRFKKSPPTNMKVKVCFLTSGISFNMVFVFLECCMLVLNLRNNSNLADENMWRIPLDVVAD
ncbi:hypothetical protein AB990_11170 [Alkalihalobacillus pseudalcaliphilus]|nr:hypothetical protein AB990_11170 [Alkalihalobacillus pseudalcaliphilus]